MALNNSEGVSKILKEAQSFDSSIVNQLLKKSENKPIHIFEIGKLTKLLLLGSRYQMIFYTVFGFAYLGIIGQEKYDKLKEEYQKIDQSEKYYEIKQERIEQKMTKIKVVTVLFCLTSALGLKVTSRMGKIIPKSIYFLPNNQFQLTFYTFFGFKKNITAPVSDFTPFSTKSKLNRTVMMRYKDQKLATIGTGVSQSNLLKYLIQQRQNK